MKALLLLITLIALPVIAGVYGALHDQLSFTIAPEYFTRFKYDQFGFEPEWFGGHRSTVAVIGFIATWWVGLLLALFIGGAALLQPDALAMERAVMRATGITLAAALMCALGGAAYGWWFIAEPPPGWYLPEVVKDEHAFLTVGSMHNASYGGAVLGLTLALTDMEWRRIRRRMSTG